MLGLRWRVEETSWRFRVVLHLDLVEGSVQSTKLLMICHPLPACIRAPCAGNAAVDVHACSLGCVTGDLMSKNLLKSFFGLADPVYLPSLSWQNIPWVPSCGAWKKRSFCLSVLSWSPGSSNECFLLSWAMVNNLSVPALCVASVKNLDHPSLCKWMNSTLRLFPCFPLYLFLAIKYISRLFFPWVHSRSRKQ